MIKKINSKKASYRKIIVIVFAVAVVFSSGFFFAQNVEAKKKAKSKVTKWQRLLEQNNVDQSLWQKYLPKVSRAEYKKVTKNLGGQGAVSGSESLGPEIKIGLFKLTEDNDKKVKITSNAGFNIKDKNGKLYKTIDTSAVSEIKANYTNKIFKVDDVAVSEILTLETLSEDGIFEIKNCIGQKNSDKKTNSIGCHQYDKDSPKYNKFRGKMELSFDKNDDNEKEAWIINQLPLEQYTWGTGEIGDLDYEYYKLFSIVFRTYGYRNLEHKKSTHEDHNFNLSDTSSDQIYKGYKIEGRYPNMKRAAEETKGKIITYKGETALTPYCSWSNGTRKTYGDYPYLKKKKDKYGKHPTKKKKQLEEEGNHRQGLIANGARKMINQWKKYNDVIQYYYPGVDVDGAY